MENSLDCARVGLELELELELGLKNLVRLLCVE